MTDPAYHDALEARLADALSTITDHWDGMTARPAIRPRGGPRPAPQSSPPVSAGVIAVRAQADMRMHVLARLLLEEYPEARPPHPDVAGVEMAEHLWGWVRELAQVVDAHAADELEHSARQVLHHSAPTRPDWMRVGACPLLLEDGSVCGGEVRGWPHHTDEAGEAWCRCEQCGTQAVVSWWEAQGMGATSEVLTTDEVCALARREFGWSLPAVTVRRWVHEGRLLPIERNARPLEFHREAVVFTLSAMC